MLFFFFFISFSFFIYLFIYWGGLSVAVTMLVRNLDIERSIIHNIAHVEIEPCCDSLHSIILCVTVRSSHPLRSLKSYGAFAIDLDQWGTIAGIAMAYIRQRHLKNKSAFTKEHQLSEYPLPPTTTTTIHYYLSAFLLTGPLLGHLPV